MSGSRRIFYDVLLLFLLSFSILSPSHSANAELTVIPVITVSPDSLSSYLSAGQVETQVMIVANGGGSDLEFSIAVEGMIGEMARGVKVSTGRNLNDARGGGGSSAAKAGGGTVAYDRGQVPVQKAHAAHHFSAANLQDADLQLLIIVSGGDPTEIQTSLMTFPDIAVVDVFHADTAVPSLAQLSNYHTAIVMINTELGDPVAVGDVLADYVDQGGGVVHTLASFSSGWNLQGRWLEEAYGAFDPGDGPIGSADLGTFADDHPIMAGVSTAWGDLLSTAPLASGAHWVASWANGEACVATRGHRVVGMNVFLANPGFWTGDIPLMLHNAVFWAAGGVGWLTTDPVAGTIPPGMSQDVMVTFDATELVGGAYDADMLVLSNDPVTPEVQVPAHLQVTGEPDIAISDSLLSFGEVYYGITAVDTLVVRNLGTDLLSVTNMSTNHPAFTVSPMSFDLAAGESQDVMVMFTPSGERLTTGTLTIQSNDPDEPVLAVALEGEGLPPPEISVSPDLLFVDLMAGEIDSTQLLTITNSGGDDLVFDVLFEGAIPGYALEFDGVFDRVDVPTVIDGQNSMTIEAWFRYVDSDTWRWVYRGSDTYSPGMCVHSGSDVMRYHWQTTEDSFGNQDGSIHLTPNTWNHIAYVYDGSTVASYINGTMDFSRNSSGAIVAPATQVIGGRGSEFFKGTIDEVRIWHVARTQAEIQEYMHRTMSGLESGLAAYWRFNEGSGSIAHDQTPHHHDGYLFGEPTWVVSDAPLGWLSVVPGSGTVAPDSFEELVVLLDATGLYDGNYHADLIILNNDPQNPEVHVPVDLHVTGEPDIAVSDTLLSFGQVFVDFTATGTLLVSNPGSTLLTVTAISCDHSDFDVSPTSFDLEASQSQMVEVSFTPGSAMTVAATLTIQSNDPDEPFLTVALVGEGLNPPDIEISPQSLFADLSTDEQEIQSITISNNGFSPLEFTIPPPELITPPGKVIVHEYEKLARGEPDLRVGDPVETNSGGPDLFGYKWQDSDELGGPVFDWIDISGVGAIAMDYGIDVSAGPFPIGFDFSFYGATFDSFRVCSNGFLSFTSEVTDFGNQEIPNPGAPANLVAPFWADLGFVEPGVVHYFNDGSRLIVQWSNFENFVWGGPYTFEIILYPSGEIFFQYLYMGSNATSATIGIQNGDGSDGLQVAFNTDYVHDNLAVRIHRVAPWLSVSPDSGSIAAGASQDLDVTFDAIELCTGSYNALVKVLSNDPYEPVSTVEATLDVTGIPEIAVSDTLLSYGPVYISVTVTDTMVVSNPGCDLLTVTDISSDHGDFTAAPTSFDLPIGGSQDIVVSYTPSSAGQVTAALSIASSDPNTPILTIAITGEGVIPPVISVTPDSLFAELFVGESETQILTVANNGGSVLAFDVVEDFGTGNEDVYQALQFDGSTGYVECADSPSLNIEESITIEAWIYVFDWEGYPRILQKGQGDNQYLFYKSGNSLAFRLAGIAGGNIYGPLPSENEWHHIAGVYNAVTNIIRIYIDGEVATSATAAGNIATTTDPLCIGTRHPDASPDDYFHGYIDEVRIWNTARSQSDLQENSSHVLTGMEQGLAAYWRFDEGVGEATTDRTLNHNDGTLFGGVTWVESEAPLSYWLHISQESGVLHPGRSMDIEVLFAAYVFGGEYSANILVQSNDPNMPQVEVPVYLQVVGVPDIIVSESTLDFGPVIVGASSTESLIISNCGYDLLTVTDISSDHADFEVSQNNFDLDPGQSQVVEVSFSPGSATNITGTLTIQSNDPDEPALIVALEGEGLVPPVISVEPDSLFAALMSDETEMQVMTIHNNGGSDLFWEILLNQVVTTKQQRTHLGMPPTDVRPLTDEALKYALAADLEEPLIAGMSDLDYVHILFDRAHNQSNVNIWSVIVSDLEARGATVAQNLLPINDELLVDSDILWITDCSDTFTPAEVSAIADWLSVGGGLILEGDDDSTVLAYNSILAAINAGITYSEIDGTAGNTTNIYLHQTTEGVGSIHLDSPQGRISAVNLPAARLADDSAGVLNSAYSMVGSGRLVAMADENFADIAIGLAGNQLFANQVFDWLAARLDWLAVEPWSGTVPPGSAQEVMVTFDATEVCGGDYLANLTILNNDPLTPEQWVPAHMHVTGEPNIAVSDTAISFGQVFIGGSAIDSVVVSNPGCDQLIITEISSNHTDFLVTPTSFDLYEGESRSVVVSFNPTNAAEITGRLAIQSNDPDEPILLVALQGEGLVAPEISVVPDTLFAALLTDETETQEMAIHNSGGNDLIFNIQGGSHFYDFDSEIPDQQLSLYGDAYYSLTTGSVYLTSAFYGNIGGLFTNYTIPASNMLIKFDFEIGGGTGADGMVLAFLDAPVLGGGGSGLGFYGTSASGWGIEFDTYGSGPDTENHMAVVNADGITYATNFLDIPEMEDTGQFSCEVYYEEGHLEVYLENESLNYPRTRVFDFDLPPFGQLDYYVGFTASTGSFTNNHIVDNFLISTGLPWLILNPNSGVVPAGSSLPINVSFNAMEMPAGDYGDIVLVTSNDPLLPTVMVPVTMKVYDMVMSVGVDVTSGILLDEGNQLGAAQGAVDTYDPGLDLLEPDPAPVEYLTGYFPHPEWYVTEGDRFHTDIRASYDPSYEERSWPFTIETDQQTTVMLTFTPSFDEASGWDLSLRDEATGESFSLFPALTYQYEPDQSQPRSFTLTVGPHLPALDPSHRTVAAGWSLIGTPLVPPEGADTWADVLLDDATGTVNLLGYEASVGYSEIGANDPAVQGQGLWVSASEGFVWTMEGTMDIDGVAVPLDEGWTLVGYPLWFAGDLADVMVDHGGTVLTYAEAVAAGLVAGAVFNYEIETDGYTAVTDLQTWFGYWIAGYASDLGLWFDHHNMSSGDSTVVAKEVSSRTDWEVTVQMNASPYEVTFGMCTGATDGFDAAFDFPVPPSSPGGVAYPEIVFPRPEWSVSTGDDFSSDFISPASEPRMWAATFRQPEPGTITLFWDSSNWPAEQDFQIYLPAENRVAVLSMREQTNVQLEVGAESLELHFRTQGFVTDIPWELAGLNLRNVPNPFNPSTEFHFNLPRQGNVEILIYDIRGALVRRIHGGIMPAGPASLSWLGLDEHGAKVASGTYFYRLTHDGRQEGATSKMSLVK